MVSVLPPGDPDTPLDDLLEWEKITDLDTWLDGYERVGDSPPTDLVGGLVNALLFERLDQAAIVRVLVRVDLFDAWRDDPVCLRCGRRGAFASPPHDADTAYLDGVCRVCRALRDIDAREGWEALGERLKQLQTRDGRRAARAKARAAAVENDQAVKRLFPEPSGRHRDDSDVEAAIQAIAGTGDEPTSGRVAAYLYSRANDPYDSLYKRLDGRDGKAFGTVFSEIKRRALAEK